MAGERSGSTARLRHRVAGLGGRQSRSSERSTASYRLQWGKQLLREGIIAWAAAALFITFVTPVWRGGDRKSMNSIAGHGLMISIK